MHPKMRLVVRWRRWLMPSLSSFNLHSFSRIRPLKHPPQLRRPEGRVVEDAALEVESPAAQRQADGDVVHLACTSHVISRSIYSKARARADEADLSTPLWEVTNWSTNFTVSNEETVLFNLTNTLTGYKAECFREGPFPNGLCVGILVEEDGVAAGEGEEDDTGTIFSYNERVGVLEIYQEWSCLGEGSVKGVKGSSNTLYKQGSQGAPPPDKSVGKDAK
ncbi:hypothetical protein QBC34DRAFT_493781 [Podospora aff. communis PSN243]|uniref:Uncharacterized protein n=1 Tax=Podospora aff. communis PSN243 TaxID=3040156 RepID=A0AAV9GS91_9PEZI|nr:hypothetical protein QBC34DRAFT_493781 [Podospora aff. communis PSN243]